MVGTSNEKGVKNDGANLQPVVLQLIGYFHIDFLGYFTKNAQT